MSTNISNGFLLAIIFSSIIGTSRSLFHHTYIHRFYILNSISLSRYLNLVKFRFITIPTKRQSQVDHQLICKMYHTHFLSALKLFLKLRKFVDCVPFKWNSTLSKLEIGEFSLRKFRLWLIIYAAYSFLQFGIITVGKFSLLRKVQAFLFVALSFTGTGVIWSWTYLPVDLVCLVNALLVYENKLGKQYFAVLANIWHRSDRTWFFLDFHSNMFAIFAILRIIFCRASPR